MKKIFSLLFIFALAFSLTSVAFAQPSTDIGAVANTGINVGSTGSISGTDTLVASIMGLVNWIAWFVGLMAVLMGLYAGILFITAGGDAAKVTTARNILLYAIVGIVVAILAFSLVSISKSIFTL